MKKIVFEMAPQPKYSRKDSQLIRVSGEIHEALFRLSNATRQPITQIANRLPAEALSAVELVETPLYNMTFTDMKVE